MSSAGAQCYENATMLDDNFTLNKERAFEFANLVEEAALNLILPTRDVWSPLMRICCADSRSRVHGRLSRIESASNEN